MRKFSHLKKNKRCENIRGVKISKKNLRGVKMSRKIIRGVKFSLPKKNKGCKMMKGYEIFHARRSKGYKKAAKIVM